VAHHLLLRLQDDIDRSADPALIAPHQELRQPPGLANKASAGGRGTRRRAVDPP
jgi:hypothetical protein